MILSKLSSFRLPALPERVVSALPLIAGVAITVVGLRLYRKYQDSQRRSKHKTYPRGVVILHQFPHGHKCPSASPFSLKLETWLRMAEIKYTNEITLYDRSANGKIPWITLNGVEVGDSQACIDYLVKLYGKDLSSHLSGIDRAIIRAFRKLTEESLRWSVLLHRYRYGKAEDVGGMPAWLYFFSAKKFLQKAYLHGCGRLGKEEIYEIGISDLRALETFLGDKKFFYGNRICEEDAAIFAMVCQVLYHDKGPLNEYLTKSCPNLLKYTETIKDDYWPDWNARLI